MGLEWLRYYRQYGERMNFEPLPWSSNAMRAPRATLCAPRWPASAATLMAIDEALPELGWTLTVMADRAPVNQARQTAWALAGLGALALLLAGLYWQLRERRAGRAAQCAARAGQRVRERTHELQEAHAFRKAMEDSLLVGMRARDLEGRIIYVNPALCEMCGYCGRGTDRPQAALSVLAPRRHGASTGATTRPRSAAAPRTPASNRASATATATTSTPCSTRRR